MGSKRIPKDTWKAVKVAYLSGLSTKEIARQYGIGEQTVATKVCKEGWNRIIKESISSVEPKQDILEKTAELLEMDWKNKGAGHRAHVFKIAHEALKRASLPAPKSWKDAQIADNMARKAAGLEESNAMTAVVNVGFLQQTADSISPRIDITDAEFEPV